MGQKEKTAQKFNVGDVVRIVKYGHWFFLSKRNEDIGWWKTQTKYPCLNEDELSMLFDVNPELVGQTGIVNKVLETQGKYKYSLSGIKGKTAWYSEDQLEPIQNAKPIEEPKRLQIWRTNEQEPNLKAKHSIWRSNSGNRMVVIACPLFDEPKKPKNMWEIIDDNGVIHSGTQEEMEKAFAVMERPDEHTPEEQAQWFCQWQGDLKLVEVHSRTR